MRLRRVNYCTKVGYDGCVNTEGAEHAPHGWSHWCPACETSHMIAVEKPFENGARWTFSGDENVPTFHPSVRVGYTPKLGSKGCCHYFIKGGRIEFCSDCTHEYAGRTVDLPDFPEGEW